ncbi:MAG TPA: HAD-IA family hydrolase [Bryobacteraceae bacterium]|nr:HAD-IA family hydrolase [Bryobacteraceae bacterium]
MSQLLIFDLDGTLIDSKRDLADAVNAMRLHLGEPPLADQTVYSYVGSGAPVLVRRALPGRDEEEIERGLRYFLEYYRDHMLDATTLYPGVREALDELMESPAKMAVLTNKPVRFSEHLIKGLGLDGHFFRIYGGNSFEEKKPHPIGIELLMQESGIGRDRTIMVGDSAVDVLTARNAQVLACGVTWGFQPETFAEAPPDFTIDRMSELVARVTSSLS